MCWRAVKQKSNQTNLLFCFGVSAFTYYICSSMGFLWVFSSPELWVYSIGRPLPSVCVKIFKHLLLWSHWADWSQISYGASMGWETNVWSNVQGHMTNMAAMPIYDENFKHSSPLETADDLESWYAALGTQALSWVVLDLFYGTIKFGPLCFCMGKS